MEQQIAPEVSNENFAEQVRAERLGVIWKSTLAVASLVVWVFIVRSTGSNMDSAGDYLLPWLMMVASAVVCRFLLQRDYIRQATWVYALGILAATSYLLVDAGQTGEQIYPFISLVAVYIVGLMLPMQAMPLMLVLNTLALIVAPWLGESGVQMPTDGALLAILMSFITAFLSVQASGELYDIAEWALENYRRERSGAQALFDSRQEIQRSLNRQRALTMELEATNAELAEARRIAEEAKHFRGQFLANMSHELRTPLNAVIGFSETMLNFPPMYNMVELPDEYRQDLSQIHNSGKHLLNIINDILDLSKIDAGRLDITLGKVELEPIIKGVMSTAVGLVGGKPVKLTRDTPDPLPDVIGDPVRVRQVLLNLYSNAAKFTEEGLIKLTLQVEGPQVIISVQDTGEGIRPEDLEHIFEEFKQGTSGRKQARAGSGLGLTISRQLLALMHGDIWAESTYGEGSIFYVALPVYTPEAELAVPQQATTKT